MSADWKYFWNYNACSWYFFYNPLIKSQWIVPFIQGYVGMARIEPVPDKRLEVLFISWRRCTRAGTWFNARGIDSDGNVANFVETEIIISEL